MIALALSRAGRDRSAGTRRSALLLAVGQDPSLARDAQVFARVQIPSIPFFLAYSALRQYLQCRGIVRPAMWVIVVANVFNALLAWALIFGHLGFPALGLWGAGLATSLTRGFCFFGLAWLMRLSGAARGAWPRPSRAIFDAAAFRRILGLGFPVAIHFSLEIWAFSGAALLAGWLGAVPLAAHTIALNLASLSFMLPLGISQGAVTRVGNLLGARRPHDARARRLGGDRLRRRGDDGCAARGFLFCAHALPQLYTDGRSTVIAVAASILPIAAAFQIFDGTQVVCCGVLRGMGRTRPAAWFNLLGYWVLGPAARRLARLPRGLGPARASGGDSASGSSWSRTSLVLFVRARGPARLALAQPVGV